MNKLTRILTAIIVFGLLTACQIESAVTHTPIPAKDMGVLQAGQEGQEAPDDIMPAPGMGPAYRANIHQQGVENPWPPIVVSESVYYDTNSREEARFAYRKQIETQAGETRNNIIKAVIQDGEISSLSLYADKIPQGITLTDSMQWSGPSAGVKVSVLVIEIASDVAPGEYPLEIGLIINGKDYGTVTCTIKVIPEEVQPQDISILEYARPYRVVSEGNIANQDPNRSVGLWFITSEEASGFEEYAQTAVQVVLDLYRLHGRDYTSVLLIPNDKLEYAGLSYGKASFAADGRGAAGMTGDAPAKEGYWVVRAANKELNEQDLAIAELWRDKQWDFPSKVPASSLSYDSEALRQYIADTLNIPFDEVQMPVLVMQEYELDQSFLDSFPYGSTPHPTGTAEPESGKWQTFSSDEQVLNLLADGNDLWATTPGGVIRWDTESGEQHRYTEKDGLNSGNTRKIIRDSNGNIWVTCYVSGVSRFDGSKWNGFTVKNGLCSNDTIALAADKKGGVWVSAYWGVSYFDGQQWTSYSNVSTDAWVVGGENPMKDCRNLTHVDVELGAVDVIFVDSRGDVWFGDRSGGVSRFDGKNWRMFTVEDGMAEGGITAIIEDKNGCIWFGSSLGNITCFDGTQFKSFIIDEYQSILPRPYIHDMLQDNHGTIWTAAYEGGVARFDGNTWRVFHTADGLPGDNAMSLFLNKDGYPGVITDKGVSLFNGNTWQMLTSADGLALDEVRAAIHDNNGNIWFGGESGVSRYSAR